MYGHEELINAGAGEAFCVVACPRGWQTCGKRLAADNAAAVANHMSASTQIGQQRKQKAHGYHKSHLPRLEESAPARTAEADGDHFRAPVIARVSLGSCRR